MTISNRIRHFFHVVSNIRPIVWIGLYLAVTPVFALIYWALPDSQFRIPEGAGTDFGSWLYYSTVTITTLGFGDYTPAHGWAQAVTAVEVMCGLIFLGLFLNAVGSMKSEIDVESEIEKQRRLHDADQKDRLLKSIPMLLDTLNMFLAYCFAVTTPAVRRKDGPARYNPDFTFADMQDMFKPSGLPFDNSRLPAVERMLQCASRASIVLDSLQNRIDMLQWPKLLNDCFAFVAGFQMFSSTDVFVHRPGAYFSADLTPQIKKNNEAFSDEIKNWKGDPLSAPEELQPVAELYSFIKQNASLARNIEAILTEIGASEKS